MDLLSVYALVRPQIVDNEVRQADGDAGDSAQRDGTIWAIAKIIEPDRTNFGAFNYEVAMKNHEVKPGYYRRTCNKEHWGYNPNNLARDQKSILQLAFAVNGDKKRLKESILNTVKRFFFHQNYYIGTDTNGKFFHDYKIPDLMHPNEIGVFIRGMDFKLLKPVLYVCDLFFLADLYFRKGSKDYDNMLFQQLAYAQLKIPTYASKLAWLLYDKDDALEKIKDYHAVGVEKNGIKGFYELFQLLNEKLKGAL